MYIYYVYTFFNKLNQMNANIVMCITKDSCKIKIYIYIEKIKKMVLPIPNESSVSWPATFYLRNSRTRNRTCVTSKKTYIPSHWIIGTTKIFYIYKIVYPF
ncbi:hypothetical protein PFAG_05885 [Plasmodium falciparum Santa Lucia]|nr:hypothetical protein PFAG_05885 [Plasmodium falciparum Santa Lucia]